MEIHPHAIHRFRERTGCKKDDNYIKVKLKELFEKAKPAKFTHPKFELFAIMNNNFEEADYFIVNGFLLVVVKGMLKTIHQNESKRWVEA